jgi:hypothetical protein
MLPEINKKTIEAELQSFTPARIVEQVCEYRRIAAEAINKIDAEGSVVRTLKGDVIAHPALKIHAEATKAEALLLKDWAARRA